MIHSEQIRKLSAILAADVAGYSRLIQDDDEATVATLEAHRKVFRDVIDRYRGRVVDMAGDSVLAVFEAATSAVRAASEIQTALAVENDGLQEHRRMRFRIGVNLGEIIERTDGTVYGDGVNVAARLESLSDPGGVMISGTVFDQVKARLPFSFAFAGEQSVKNISEPVRAYKLGVDQGAPSKFVSPSQRSRPKFSRVVVGGVAAAIILVLATVAGWHYTRTHSVGTKGAAHDVNVDTQGVSVAVLPFDNLSGDAAQDFFADGVSDELITTLGQFQNLRVAARHNSFRFKGKSQDIRTAGNDLRVRYVLTGSVRKTAESVRVSAQLLQVDSETQIWSQTYQRPLTAKNVFDIQQELSANIATAIGSRTGVMVRTESTQSQAKAPTNLSAYECFMRWIGVYQRTLAKGEHAIAGECLERAVEVDPNYAEAWAALSDIYNDEFKWGYNPRPGNPLDRALRAAERAIQLNPQSQNAYKSLAVTHYFRGERDEFLTAADHAVALGPNEPNILAGLSNYLYYAGERKKALAMMDKAIQLDPFPVDWYYFPYFWEHYRNAEYDAALAVAQKINIPNYPRVYQIRAACLGQLGRIDAAKPNIQKLLELDPEFELTARAKLRKAIVYDDALIDQLLEGLRKAGMKIPK